MDPVSFSASIITILALSAKLSIKLKDIVGAKKDTPSELSDIQDELQLLTWVIERLGVLSKREQQRGTVAWSRAFYDVPNQGPSEDIGHALQSCTNVMNDVRLQVEKVERYLNGGAWDRMKYPFFVTSERTNLRELRSRLAHNRMSILMSLQLRTLGMVETASSTSQESQILIQELLELVQELKAQKQHPPTIWSLDTETPMLRSTSDQSPVPPPLLLDEQVPDNARVTGGFDLEIHSGLDALLARFRSGVS